MRIANPPQQEFSTVSIAGFSSPQIGALCFSEPMTSGTTDVVTSGAGAQELFVSNNDPSNILGVLLYSGVLSNCGSRIGPNATATITLSGPITLQADYGPLANVTVQATKRI